MHQQQDKNYFRPPVSPIPPIQDNPNYRTINNILCRYCNQPIIIRYERIEDSDKGKPRHRNVPRSEDGNIHACRFPEAKETNSTLKQEGVS